VELRSTSIVQALVGLPVACPVREDDPVSDAERATRDLLVELLGAFYARGWVSGTGGGICGPADGGGLLLAPTGVHKERVRPDEFFTVDPADGSIQRSPAGPDLRPSECNQIFCLASRERGARSVVHSHALSAVLAGDLAVRNGADHVAIRDLEMLKGIRGLTNRDVHLVPVVRNTAREPELVGQLQAVLADPRFAGSFAVLVADHGAYIWGDDVWEAKRHTEVYHFLFEATVARRDSTIAASSPSRPDAPRPTQGGAR
jgi:methylthioribulose-1-phosphate dehydratase